MIATVVIDAVARNLEAYIHLERLGYIMVASTCIPYFLAIICFMRAGKHYLDFRKCLHYCKEATLANIKIKDYLEFKIVERKS